VRNERDAIIESNENLRLQKESCISPRQLCIDKNFIVAEKRKKERKKIFNSEHMLHCKMQKNFVGLI